MRAAVNGGVRQDDLACLHDLLEAAEVFLDLLARLASEHGRHRCAGRARRRGVAQVDAHQRPAPARRPLEAHRSLVLNGSAW